MIVNTNLYNQLEAGSTGGNIAIPGGTGTLTEQHLLALIEQKAKEILGSAVDAQRSFGFQAGENYYSPISYWWADYYNRDKPQGSNGLKPSNSVKLSALSFSTNPPATGEQESTRISSHRAN